MNLHEVVAGAIGVVNPPTALSIQLSSGYVTNPDGSRVPQYEDPVTVYADVQALDAGDIQHLDGLNIQGRRMAFYISGNIDGLIRLNSQGGDLITIVAGGNNSRLIGTIWLVAVVLEYWPSWCKVAAVMQNQKASACPAFVPVAPNPGASGPFTLGDSLLGGPDVLG